MARQYSPKAVGKRVRPIRRTQARSAETIEAALVQPLIGESPGDGFAGPQLFATYCTRFAANSRLHVGERSSSAARWSHGSWTSNHGASIPPRAVTQVRCQASALQLSPGMDSRRTQSSDRWQRMLAGVRSRRRPFTAVLEKFSSRVTTWAGSSSAFALALLVILVWAITGPIFHFSDTWQLVINTGTTIVTFLMVFLIQRSQNKDAVALHLKLNELVAAVHGASNRLINVEDLSESEVRMLHRHYGRLAELSRENNSLTESHSIEQAVTRHVSKQKRRRSASVSGSVS
jgi:low affinity Fe/Cu permease